MHSFAFVFLIILLGSYTGVVVSQLLPVALHLRVFKKKHGLWLYIEDWIVLVLFTFVLIICTASSVIDMIDEMKWFVCWIFAYVKLGIL